MDFDPYQLTLSERQQLQLHLWRSGTASTMIRQTGKAAGLGARRRCDLTSECGLHVQ